MHGDIEIELARSREIIVGGAELVPRFRILTPEGAFTIFVQFPDDFLARNNRMQLVSDFMMVRMATAFVFATEIVEQEQIGEDLSSLLPDKVSTVTPEMIAAVEALIRYNGGMQLDVGSG